MPDPAAVSEFRTLLERRLREVVANLGAAEDGAATVALDQTRVGRLSRIDALQQQALAAGRREALLTERRRLEAAVERVRSGRYGICCRCEGEVDAARLRADPATPFCIECLREIDAEGTAGR